MRRREKRDLARKADSIGYSDGDYLRDPNNDDKHPSHQRVHEEVLVHSRTTKKDIGVALSRRKVVIGIGALVVLAGVAGFPAKDANAQALSPVVARLSPNYFDITTYPGVVANNTLSSGGSSPGNALRQANGAALQAAFDYCTAHKLIPGAPPATAFHYEASKTQNSQNVGLQLSPGAAGLLGGSCDPNGAGTAFIQYASNQAALTIGDVSNTAANLMQYCTFSGFVAGFGIDQTGNTQAIGILWGRTCFSLRSNIAVSPYLNGGNFAPYIGFMHGISTSQFDFSNHQTGIWECTAAQASYEKFNANTTGNEWGNKYYGTGTFGSRVPLSSSALWFSASGCEYGNTGEQNIEWTVSAAAFLRMDGFQSNYKNIHMEGLEPNGVFNGYFIDVVGGSFTYDSLRLLDCWIASANGVGGVMSVFGSFNNPSVDGRVTLLYWNGSGYNAEAVCTYNLNFMQFDSGFGRTPQYVIRNLLVVGIGTSSNPAVFGMDTTMPGAAVGANGQILGMKEWTWVNGRSRSDGAVLYMGITSMTVYGQFANVTVQQNGTLTGNIALTLSEKMAASGESANALRPSADSATLQRFGGGAFNLVQQSSTPLTLATLTAASTQAVAIYDGTLAAWN